MDLNLHTNSRPDDPSAITLWTLFQVLTSCCIFFAILRLSPLLALLATVIIAPALIRTAWVSDLYRRQRQVFCWQKRLRYFTGSLGVVLTAVACGAVAFIAVSLSFGLVGLLFGLTVSSDFCFDAAVIGATGGMIWGMAGALFAASFAACKLWKPQSLQL